MHLTEQLQLPRCPHCKIALPTLKLLSNHTTTNHAGVNARKWGVYCCTGCGGLVTAWAEPTSNMVQHVFPGILPVDRDIPERPRAYLQQASDSLHAPAGSIMLSASSVDSMLKIKNYIEGSLYKRIEQAAADHLITEEMAKDRKVRIVVLLEYGTPQERMLTKSRELGVDLMIFGQATGRGARGRFLDRSLQQVLEHSPCPVLIVK